MSNAWLLCCVVLFLVSACAPVTQHYAQVESLLTRQQYAEADAEIEKAGAGYGPLNRVLYDMDRAMTLHLAGRFADSNRHLQQAEDRIDALYTQSLSAEAASLLSNDNILPYQGEDFEKVMINALAALNYVYLGQLDEALVEARKVDHKLNVLNDRHEKKNVYKEDAFARYLSGVLYEARGEMNDAFIAYRKAYQTYQSYRQDYGTPMPPALPEDLLRSSEAVGLLEEHQAYRAQFADLRWTPQSQYRQRGELIFISLDGRAPVKQDDFINAPLLLDHGLYPLRIAVPRFVPSRDFLDHTVLRLVDTHGVVATQTMFLAEDVDAIARKNLQDRIGRIMAKAIARATAKYAASKAIREKAGDSPLAVFAADFGTSIFALASEQSDKRSWRTLPAAIRMARILAPPGDYQLEAEYYDLKGSLLARRVFDVKLVAGQKRFISNRFLGSKGDWTVHRQEGL